MEVNKTLLYRLSLPCMGICGCITSFSFSDEKIKTKSLSDLHAINKSGRQHLNPDCLCPKTLLTAVSLL